MAAPPRHWHNPLADTRRRATLRRKLLRYYGLRRRDLPWRRTHDPWAIWVSEIMLQQTQVQTVIPRYHEFLRRFPTVQALAAAPEQAVAEAWAGLGYYRRARLLYRGARAVVEQHGGVVPDRASLLLTLPGVGRYTAGAIASIAFGEAVPIVDGNVERVIARLLALPVPPKSRAGSKVVWDVCGAWVAGEAPGDFNQSLMELGATVCVPIRPRCLICPLRDSCAARAQGLQEQLPLPMPKQVRQPLDMAFALRANAAGVWLTRRPLEGLWAGLWEPPSAFGDDATQALAQRLRVSVGKPVACVKHTLTHRDVVATVFWVPHARLQESDACRAYAQPFAAPLSTLARKVLLAGLKSAEVRRMYPAATALV